MSVNTPSTYTWRAQRYYKRAPSSKPRLPAELETLVLNTFQDLHSPEDLTWLWVGGRHVSKHFRHEIERIFGEILLPEIVLRCDLGLRFLCWDIFEPGFHGFHAGCNMQKSTAYGSWDDEPFFTFDGFSKDKTRALFKFAHLKHPKETVFRRLHEKQLVGSPVFSIQVREVVNDTGVPDLQIDDEKKEISFHWKEMFDQLLGEEHVFNTILSQRLGWHLDPGEETPDLLDTHRKLARRSRLQRECRSKYGSNILDHYMHEETQALEELQRLRLAASRSDDTNSGEHNHNNLTVYTKQQIADELPNGAIIYSGNFNAGPNPGSIPRGIFTNRDYCWPGRSYTLPPPSAADLFSPRPMPILSRGRERIGPARKPRKPKGAREGDEGYVITPVVTPIEERMSFLQPTASPP